MKSSRPVTSMWCRGVVSNRRVMKRRLWLFRATVEIDSDIVVEVDQLLLDTDGVSIATLDLIQR
jgi:hypothetical protein